MIKKDSLAEKAKRLTAETYTITTLAMALQRRAEELEKEMWKFVKELERHQNAGR